MTKLAAKLPDGERNGLSAIERHLVDEPQHVHAAIVLISSTARP